MYIIQYKGVKYVYALLLNIYYKTFFFSMSTF